MKDLHTIKLIEHKSAAYDDAIALRYQILRKPLNLHFTDEQLAEEKNNYHLGLYIGGDLVAYLMLEPHADKKIKMKQVAVAEAWQGRGLGAKLVVAAEKLCAEKGFELIYCHARDTAVPFYEKLGYTKTGSMFLEVTIPHYYFEKKLKP